MEEIRWFISNFPDFVKNMKSCSYHYNKDNLDLEHLENNVWNHAVISYSKALNYKYSNIIRWAVLLHDIGRIKTKRVDIKTKTIYFGSYYGVSVFLAYEILNKTTLSQEEILRVIKIISYQNQIINFLKNDDYLLEKYFNIFEYDSLLFKDLIYYARCDLHGRKIDESLKNDYKKMYKKLECLEKQKIVFKKEKNFIKKEKNLYLLVGPPCSGKSTWRKNFNEESHVFCRDEFILKIAEKYKVHTYNKAFILKKTNKNINDEVNKLTFEKEKELLSSSCKNIIIDNVNLSIEYRKYWINIFRKTHNIHLVLLLTPYSLFFKRDIKRFRQTSKSIGKFAMIDNFKHFEYPLLSEDIDSIDLVLNK